MEGLFSRHGGQLIARDSGPFYIRLILPPLVATLLGIRAGWRDAYEISRPRTNAHGLGPDNRLAFTAVRH